MNTKTDTPRTDEAWAAWPYAGPGISVHFGRELERELKAVTEQRDRLAEALRSLIEFPMIMVECIDGGSEHLSECEKAIAAVKGGDQ